MALFYLIVHFPIDNFMDNILSKHQSFNKDSIMKCKKC